MKVEIWRGMVTIVQIKNKNVIVKERVDHLRYEMLSLSIWRNFKEAHKNRDQRRKPVIVMEMYNLSRERLIKTKTKEREILWTTKNEVSMKRGKQCFVKEVIIHKKTKQKLFKICCWCCLHCSFNRAMLLLELTKLLRRLGSQLSPAIAHYP